MSGITDEAVVEAHDLIQGAERRASQDNYTLVTSGLIDDDGKDLKETPAGNAGDDKTMLGRAMDKTKNILRVNKV
ncbi:hypothetical protein NQ176_g336 [Zarea fungicola]|uniref:Uncharacterized protein n=1 Tax=Zarea fungicola TaxID=93591 RepID=A0ACC1NZR6_9HYPO|nr:hypothetical protein NQ176_g336 [Lecanicillium fungicola]